MLLRLYNDDTPLIDNSKDRFEKSRPNNPEPSASAPTGTTSADEPETIENGVEDADIRLNAERATEVVAALEPGAEEVKALKDEDRIMAFAQQKADDAKETAPGVDDEEDVFNKTV